MACQTHCCVFSRGEFFIADYAASCAGTLQELFCGTQTSKPFRKLGNISSALVEISSSVLGIENEFNPVSETCPRSQVENVSLTVTLECASKDNLILALYGEAKELDSGSHVVDFCINSLSSCDFFPYEKQKALHTGHSVVLKDPFGVAIATLVEDVDYKWSASGIEIINDSIVLGAAVTLRLIYDYNNANIHEIEFLDKQIGYKSIFFKGTNYADDSSAMFNATFKKVLFAPVDQFDLISKDSLFSLTLRGTVEKVDGSHFKLVKEES